MNLVHRAPTALAHNTVSPKHHGAIRNSVIRKDSRLYLRAIAIANGNVVKRNG